MRILLTGGAGFIGNCLLWLLNQKGHDNIIVCDHLGTSEKWRYLTNKKFIDYIERDDVLALIDKNRLNDIDMVIHFGACTSTRENNASFMIKNNYLFSQELALWAFKYQKRFLYASSASTYGAGEHGYSDDDAVSISLKPLNIYGYSKQLFDLWIMRHKLQKKCVGLKFFNVFGPNEYHKGEMRSLVAKSYNYIIQNHVMKLFKSYRAEYADGEQKRDFIYIKDAINMVYFFIEHSDKTGIYNIGSGTAHTWNELAAALFAALNMKINVQYIEMPEELRDRYQYFTQADMSKLKKAGYTQESLSLPAAVKDYITYLQTKNFI